MNEFSVLADLLDPPKTGVLEFYNDPAGFALECFDHKRGETPHEYQLENLSLLAEHKRLAVRAGRSAGKTTTHAWAALWFGLTREAAGDDWMVIVTAYAYRQLKDYFWKELERKWAPRLDWERMGRRPFRAQSEMMREELRLPHGSIILAAVSDPAKIEGAHANQLLCVFDEAASIPDTIYDAIEGVFAGAGEDAAQDAYVLASGTPKGRGGRFFDIHRGAKGLDDWHTNHVHVDRLLAVERVGRKYLKEREEQFGPQSAWFHNNVLGEFADESSDGVISQAYLDEAVERWKALELPQAIHTGAFQIPNLSTLGPLHAVGVDLAAGGEDRTVYALRYGNTIGCLMLRPKEPDTTVPTNEVRALLHSCEPFPVGVIDAGGLGIPVYYDLKKLSCRVTPFTASVKSPLRVRGTGQGFVDSRAAAWWHLRECLEPGSGMDIAIPDDQQLVADLLAPHWREVPGGKVRVEEKKEIRKRLKRSTDAGDAVVQAFWTSAVSSCSGSFFAEQVGASASRWGSLRPGAAMEGQVLQPNAPAGRPF